MEEKNDKKRMASGESGSDSQTHLERENMERKVEALGRPMQLGMLYDCRADTPIAGIPFWDQAELQNHREVLPMRDSHFDVITTDSMDDKASALNIGTPLKASLLSKLVKVTGSAKYINDKRTTDRQYRLTLHYKTTTRLEQLNMKHLGRHNVQDPCIFNQGIATHVVTRIVYGAQAFFVFDRNLEKGESEKNVQGSLDTIVKKIPSLSTEFEEEWKLNDWAKEEAEKIKCTFFGDFALENEPANYTEAVTTYKKLPSMLGKNGELAVPMTVWLYPLSKLDSKATTLVREISVDLVNQAQHILEGLDKFQIKCDDLKNCLICSNFQHFIEKLDVGKEQIAEYKLAFQEKLGQILPIIRGGGEGEQVMSSLLLEMELSPFNLQNLGAWIKNKEKEISIMKAYMKDLSRFKVIHSREEMEELVIDPGKDHLVCFFFPFTGHDDKYLNHMTHYNKRKKSGTYKVRHGWFDDDSSSKKMRLQARQFSDFASANETSAKTQSVVMCFDDWDIETQGGSVLLYQHGVLITNEFTPPGKPGKPEIADICHDAVTIKWTKAGPGSVEIQNYLVKYKEETNTSGWCEQKTDDETDKATISNLKPNTSYKFTVAAVSSIGVGLESEASNMAKTLAACPPYGVRKYHNSKSSITLVWNEPMIVAEGSSVVKYCIKYKSVTDDTDGCMKETEESNSLFTIKNLEPEKTYRIWVSADCGKDGTSKFCDPIDITTLSERKSMQTIATELTKHAVKISDGAPSIYKLSLSAEPNRSGSNYKIYSFGKQSLPYKRHRVIMVVGATGAGKSTLIDGMMNYILNVNWGDPFRFKIISEHGENPSDWESQTQLITSYTIHHQRGFNVPSTVTLIDTPGFGDTRGIQRDRVIIDQISEFFSQSAVHCIDHIDAIGFVAQASQARLTHTQRYVFDSILSIFGRDIAQNIVVLTTFADGQKPAFMDAIKAANIPCGSNIFKFNNSALFAQKKAEPREPGNIDYSSDEGESDDCFDKLFWLMGVQSMKKFFDALGTVTTRSLTLTQDALEERECLKAALEGLQTQIQIGCCKLEGLRKEYKILEQHGAYTEANKNVKYEVQVPTRRKIITSGNSITNCSKCHFTCHYPCPLNDEEKIVCVAMKDGSCTVCTGKCVWNLHFNQPYRYEYYEETETRTYSELQKRYRDATGKTLTTEQVTKKHQEEFVSVQKSVSELITQAHKSLKRLEEIALRPNPLSTVEYVELLIEAEKLEAKPGWQARVKHLQYIRKETDILGKIKQANYNPFESYKKEFHEKQRENKDKAWYKIW